MEFLDLLKAHLTQPGRRRSTLTLDVTAHRKHFLQRLDALKSAGTAAPDITRLYHDVSPGLDAFLEAVGRLLIWNLGENPDANPDFATLINAVIDRRLGVPSTTGSIGLDLEIDRICQSATNVLRKYGLPENDVEREIERYAVEISAVTRRPARAAITEIGKLFLTLSPRDALRWLLAVEVTQSLGPHDEWRLCRSSAKAILEMNNWEPFLLEEADDQAPASWGTLRRLEKLGLVYFHDTGRGTELFGVQDESRPLLEEVAADTDTPFTLLARALLQDQTAATLAGLPGAAALLQREGATTVATRHAQMVAHEIRNSLVPVQAALEGLYEEIERRGQTDALAKRRERIDTGIERIFRFVRDVAQVADLSARPAELFDLAVATSSAIASLAPELGRSIPFAQEAALAPVIGHRERFVLALLSLLRNAVQCRAEPPVEIRITAGLNNGAEVFVRIDDDGPGVAPDDRSRIFEPGFSRRPGGSGQGLAFVREVVESEMAGRVLCEDSPLGGARFTVRLPIGTKRSQ